MRKIVAKRLRKLAVSKMPSGSNYRHMLDGSVRLVGMRKLYQNLKRIYNQHRWTANV